MYQLYIWGWLFRRQRIRGIPVRPQCLKIAKMSHSTMRAKRATFIVRLPDRSILIGQKLVENDRIVKPKWDILDNFQTMWNSCKTFFEARSLSINKKRSPRRVHPCLFLSRQFLQSTLRGVVKYLSSWMKTQVAYSSCCFLLSFLFRRGFFLPFFFPLS